MTSLSNCVAAALLAVRVLLDISKQRLEQWHGTSDVISTLHKLSSEGFRDWFLDELYTLEVRASSDGRCWGRQVAPGSRQVLVPK